MRHFVLDGHNILFKDAGSKSALSSDPSRTLNRLVTRCKRIVAGKNNKCSIIFDGSPPGDIISNTDNVQVTFSYDRSADSLIKSLIARSKNPRNLVVISDDVEIQKFARAHSCRIQSVRQFLNQILQPGAADESEKTDADDLSIEEWLRLFKK